MRIELSKDQQKRDFAVADITTLKAIDDEERARMAERYGRDVSWAQTKVFLRDEKQPILVRETVEQIARAGLALVTLKKGTVFIADNVKDLGVISGEEKDKVAAGHEGGLNAAYRTAVYFYNGAQRWSTVPKAQLGDRIEKALGRPFGRIEVTGGGPVGDQAEGGPT